MEGNAADLLALLAVVVGLAAGYGRVFGGYQTQIVQWVIDACAVKSRFRGVVNLAVGTALALAFSAFAAWQLGEPSVMAAGLLAGFLASVEAGKKHDEASPAE